MLRRWLLGVREPRTRRPATEPRVTAISALRQARPQRGAWVVAIALVAAVLALAWAATWAPVSEAAGNPLYLHGGGRAPDCTGGTIDQTVGTKSPPCAIRSSSGGVTTVFAFSGLPAQTIASGVWSFVMNWTGGSGSTLDSVSITAGVSATGSCAGFTATVPNSGTTWTTTYGANGTHTTSPFTVTTSASQAALVIPSGGSLCIAVRLTHSTGGRPSMTYDGAAGTADTRVVPPTSVVPESLLGLLGLAVAIPLLTGRRRLWSLVRSRR